MTLILCTTSIIIFSNCCKEKYAVKEWVINDRINLPVKGIKIKPPV